MVTIALPSDIEEPLSEHARRRGMTPEQLAIETLRATFTSEGSDEGQPKKSLFDFLSGHIGTVDGSTEPLSPDSGRLFGLTRASILVLCQGRIAMLASTHCGPTGRENPAQG